VGRGHEGEGYVMGLQCEVVMLLMKRRVKIVKMGSSGVRWRKEKREVLPQMSTSHPGHQNLA
jgi:hypothetical protein